MSEPILKSTADRSLTAFGGLHYIKGNTSPYFSLTGEERENGRVVSCGCMHEPLLDKWPELADLAALHLSDLNGVPMYAVENGWYFYGGTKWQARDNAALARHLRITMDVAEALSFENKAQFALFVDGQRTRWAAEARECIAHHQLVVFGDNWKGEAA